MKRPWILVILALLLGACTTSPSKLTEDPRVAAAQSQVSFQLLVPQVLPAGYALTDVTTDKQSDSVLLTFAGSAGTFTVYQGTKPIILEGVVESQRLKGVSMRFQESESTGRRVVFETPEKVTVEMRSTSLGKDQMLSVSKSMVK